MCECYTPCMTASRSEKSTSTLDQDTQSPNASSPCDFVTTEWQYTTETSRYVSLIQLAMNNTLISQTFIVSIISFRSPEIIPTQTLAKCARLDQTDSEEELPAVAGFTGCKARDRVEDDRGIL